MASRRRAVLLALLTVTLALFLLDAHGSPVQMVADLRAIWNDMRQSSGDDAP